MDRKLLSTIRSAAFAYCECSDKYFGHGVRNMRDDSVKIKYFSDVSEYCIENLIDVALFVEAQFYCLTDFFKSKGVRSLPVNTINDSAKAIERYNRFLSDNLEISGTYSQSEKSLVNDDPDKNSQKLALFEYVLSLLRGNSKVKSAKIAQNIYSKFKVTIDRDTALDVITKVCPTMVSNITFEDGWDWEDLRQFLIDLGVLHG